MDEVLTPDSSRYWPLETYREGDNPPSYDKQFVRDWLEAACVNGLPWNKRAPAPALPREVIEKTAAQVPRGIEPFGRMSAPARPLRRGRSVPLGGTARSARVHP